MRYVSIVLFNLFTITVILPLVAYHWFYLVALLTWKFITSKE